MSNEGNPIEAVRARLDGGRKWIKGEIENAAGSCLIGATRGDYRLVTLMEDVVVEQYPDRLGLKMHGDGPETLHPVASFNDHSLTTWPEVDAVLEKTAIAWDEQHSGGAL